MSHVLTKTTLLYRTIWQALSKDTTALLQLFNLRADGSIVPLLSATVCIVFPRAPSTNNGRVEDMTRDAIFVIS